MRDRSRGEGLDISFRAALVHLFMPAWKGRKKDEADKSKNDGDDSVREAGLVLIRVQFCTPGGGTYIKYGKTIASLNVLATHMRFNGSWSTDT